MINVERQIKCLFKSLHISTLEVFLFEDTEEKVCQKMDMLEKYLKKQSMHNVYSVILEYEEKQEAESIGSHTIIDGGWVRNT